jgi:hypothetical protein
MVFNTIYGVDMFKRDRKSRWQVNDDDIVSDVGEMYPQIVVRQPEEDVELPPFAFLDVAGPSRKRGAEGSYRCPFFPVTLKD